MALRKVNQDSYNNNNTADIAAEEEGRQHEIKNVRFKTQQHEHVKEGCNASSLLLGETMKTTSIPTEESVNIQIKSTVKETKEEEKEEECIMPYLCPLCLSAGIRQPVFLHASTEEDSVTNSVCIACAECAKLWFSMNASIESTRDSCIITSHTNKNKNNNNNNMSHDGMLTPLQCPQCAMTIISSNTTTPVPFTSTSNSNSSNSTNCVIRNCKVNIENKRPATAVRVCGICEEVTAEQYCIPCGFPLCLSCQTSSHQRGRYRTHNVVPLRAAPQERKEVHKCETHTTQTLELYCFTCHSAVCLMCCFGGHHKEHIVEPIADVAEKMRCNVKQEVQKHEKDAHAAVETVRGLHTATGSLEIRFAKVREMIQRQFDTLRSALNTREAALQEELLKYEDCVKYAITQQASKCETISTAVEQSAVRVNYLIKTTDAVEMVYLDPVLKKSIEVLGTAATETFMRGRSALQIIEERLTCEDGVVAFLSTPQEEEECVKVLKSFGSLQFPTLMHRTVSTRIGSAMIDNTCMPLVIGAPKGEKETVKDLNTIEKNTLSTMESLMIHKTFKRKDDESFIINEGLSLQQVSQQRDTTPSVRAAAALMAPFSSHVNSSSQELQLVWDQPRYTDDLSRSTVPSLMMPSSNVSNTVDNISSISSLSFNKGAELHVLQTRKRLLDMDTNTVTDKEMMMPACKQRKMLISDETLSGTMDGGVKGLMLPKRHIRSDDGVTSASLLQEGEKMKLIDFNSKSDDSMTPTTGVASSLHLQLRF